MSPKYQIPNFLYRSLARRNTKTSNVVFHCFCKPVCTMNDSTKVTESPELPDWIEFFDTKGPSSADSEDDNFVIPSLANWVESQKLEHHGEAAKHLLSNASDGEVDNISKILKHRYPSPDNVFNALNGHDFIPSSSLVQQLLKRFCNDWIPAFGVFKWAKAQTGYVHSTESYNSMVDILGKSKKFQLMWELVEEMTHLEGYVTLFTMTKVIRRLSRAGKYEDAIDTFRRIEQFGVTKDTSAMNVLMDALVKENSVENAQDVFVEMKKSIPSNSSSFNVLIHGWCKARKLDDALKTMKEMEKHGFSPDVITHTSFIEAYCREKDFRRANQILDEMKTKGCMPNAVTYTILMHSLGKAKQINEALKVYEKMKTDGCVPDSSFYSSLIFILGKAGRLKDAKDLVEDMTKQGVTPDVLTYNTLISCACAHSQEETALRLLQKMVEDSCRPDLKTYHPLLKMCCRKKRMKVLKFLLDHMLKNDVSIEVGTYAVLVRGLCKSGKLDLACSFFEEMVSKGMVPKESTYKMLKEELEGKSMSKEMEQIEKLMCQVKEQKNLCSNNSDYE